jgi:hypothetical protein
MHEKRRVILTKDHFDTSKPRGNGEFKRNGYVGIYEIGDITDSEGLRFRFVKRLADGR